MKQDWLYDHNCRRRMVVIQGFTTLFSLLLYIFSVFWKLLKISYLTLFKKNKKSKSF